MRILLIHQYFLEKDEGGGSRFNEMTRTWAEQGHEVTVLAGMVHYTDGKKRPKYKGKYIVVDPFGENVTVIRCHVSEAYNLNYLGRLWGYISFVISGLYAGLFKAQGKYDLLIVTSPPLFLGITAYLLGLFKRIPFVFEVRDLWPESAIDTGVLTNKWIIKAAFWFERFIYRKSKLISVLTPAFKERLIAKGVPEEKIVFIPNAADFSISDQIIDNPNFDRVALRNRVGWNGKKVITYVGAHGVANHLIQVVDTAELLRDRPDIHFVLIGNGMQKEMLMEEVAIRKLTNIQFLDPVPKYEVFKYIYASDFGISVLKKVNTFKSIYSNKTFDYMACKRPILMLIDGVSRKLVEEAGCGIYIEPENPTDFRQKLLQLLEQNEASLQAVGNAGYEYAKKNFDRERLAREYIKHLEKIVKE